MKIQNSFDVPLPVERTWDLLLDIQRIAPCLPGAELLEIIDAERYRGKVSLRIGPVAVTFQGIAKFERTDPISRQASVSASGNEIKGRGGAQAKVDFALTGNPASGTHVQIDTDLTLNGAVAQYGRAAGIISDIAQQLVDRFAVALKDQIEADASAAPPAVSLSTEASATSTQSAAPPYASPPPAKPISGFALILNALARGLRRWLGRLIGTTERKSR